MFTSPVASSRTRAPSSGGTSSTRSPAASSCWPSRWPRPPPPSTAQVRCGQAAAHASSRSAWAAQARTRSSPSGSSAALIATAVCEALCGSTPIITAAMENSFPYRRARTVAGTPNSRTFAAFTPLLSHATARPRQAGTSFESQPQQGGRRLESQATGTSQRYDPGSFPSRPGPHRLLKVSIGLISRGPCRLVDHALRSVPGADVQARRHRGWPRRFPDRLRLGSAPGIPDPHRQALGGRDVPHRGRCGHSPRERRCINIRSVGRSSVGP